MTQPKASSGFQYIPKPIKKTRSFEPHPIPKVDRPLTSIQINMSVLEQVSSEQAQSEADAIQKIVDFVPLSATPPPSFTSQAQFDLYDRVRPDSEIAQTQEMEIHSFRPSHHWGLWFVFFMVLTSIWVGGISLQVGFDRFLGDPIGATKSVLFGDLSPTVSQVKNSVPLRSETIQEDGELKVKINGVSRYKNKAIIIEGEVINETRKEKSNISLVLELTYPSELSQKQREEGSCCRSLTDAQRESDIELWLKEKQTKTPTPLNTKISSGDKVSFSWVVPLTAKRGLKRGDLPTAKVRISFFE